jgi:hypothetical protein
MRLATCADLAAVQAKRCWNRRALVADWLPGDLAEALWREPERLLAEGAVLQHRGVRHSVRVDWNQQRFVLKHYTERNWLQGLRQLVTPSRARRTWDIMNYLADSGVLTPRPAACIEETYGPLQLNSYLLYPYVTGETVKQLLLNRTDRAELRDALMPRFEAIWEQLRAIDASLEDANPDNFILTPDGQLWVIDLDKARKWNVRVGDLERKRTWRLLNAEMVHLVRGGRGKFNAHRQRLAA